jgi:hypothetical protein
MANAAYRKLSDNSYLQQSGNGGGPLGFRVSQGSDGNWYGAVTSNWGHWVLMPDGFATQAAAQAILDAYVVQLNAGTA